MDCNTCKDLRHDAVPYVAHEADMARQERTIKRLWVLLIILVALLVGTNCAWLWYESQFEDIVVEQEVEQETDGGGNNSNILDMGGYDG